MAAADNNDSILLEAGSDPSYLKLQGDTAPLELLAEVCRVCTTTNYIWNPVPQVCNERGICRS